MPQNHIFIPVKGEKVKVDVREILYIEGQGRMNAIHTITKKYTIDVPLRDLEIILAPNNFIRIHKSYIIPFNRIKSHKKRQILLREAGPDKSLLPLPVGRAYEAVLLSYCRVVEKSPKNSTHLPQSVTCQNSQVPLTN